MRVRKGVWLALCALSGIAGCRSGVTGPLPSGSETTFRDEFAGESLEGGWTFEGPEENRTLSERVGFFRVYARQDAGELVEAEYGLLLREVSGDFVIRARMEFDPLADRHIAGLSIDGGNEDRISFGLLKASGPRGSFRGVVPVIGEGATRELNTSVLAYDGTDLYLRVARQRDQFRLGYSADGVTYVDVGTVTWNLPDTVRVGVGSAISEDCNGGCDQIAPADFDFFEIARIGEEE